MQRNLLFLSTFFKLYHVFQVDAECSKELEQWNEMLKSDAIKLCQENNFNPGFFEGDNNCVIDAYELKVIFTLLLSNLKFTSSRVLSFMKHFRSCCITLLTFRLDLSIFSRELD